MIDSDESKIVLFSGSKGGCGCSFITYCVSTYLARETTKNILLLDLNIGKKDSRMVFSQSDESLRDLGDIERVIDELDISILKKIVINFENSLNLILPPVKIEKSSIIDKDKLEKILDMLKEHFDIICVDFPNHLFSQNKLCLKEFINKFVFVSLPDLISVNNLNTMTGNIICDELHYDFDIIINKYNTRPAVSPSGLNTILKYPIDAFIPYDRDIEFLMLNRGPDSVFKYNLRIVHNISAFSRKLYEDLSL
jgi:MinD-like ATPase involved in chromosome partitioning or flagellar assembly